ncbi:MAG: hypothetical protein JXA01_05920 [Dehalococcoidia bacterium]|nr:hypothetical protein [Dehalococcoidia bacterium]
MYKIALSIVSCITVILLCLACTPSTSTSSEQTDNTAASETAPSTSTVTGKSTTQPATTAAPTANPIAGLPIINSFMADPAIISPKGLSNLKWDISDATAISISPDLGSVSPIGTRMIQPSTSTQYKVTASNAKGAVTAVATVMIEKPYSYLLPVVLSYKLNPRIISENDTCTLSWNVYAADYVTLEQTAADVTTEISSRLTPKGKLILTPAYALTSGQLNALAETPITVTTTSYTITATNRVGESSAAVDVTVLRKAIIPKPDIPIIFDNMTVMAATVLPIIKWFSAEPYTIIQGNTATLTWEVDQADEVTLNGVAVEAKGSQVVSPAGATSYTLYAINEYWTSIKTVTIYVLGYAPEYFKPVAQ